MFTGAEGLTACHPRSARRLSGLNPLFGSGRGSEEHTGKRPRGGKGSRLLFLRGGEIGCLRYVCARESWEIQASERAASAPESDRQGRNGADVELSAVRQKGGVHQVRDRGHFASAQFPVLKGFLFVSSEA